MSSSDKDDHRRGGSRIPILTDKNWRHWSEAFLTIIESKGQLDYLNGTMEKKLQAYHARIIAEGEYPQPTTADPLTSTLIARDSEDPQLQEGNTRHSTRSQGQRSTLSTDPSAISSQETTQTAAVVEEATLKERARDAKARTVMLGGLDEGKSSFVQLHKTAYSKYKALKALCMPDSKQRLPELYSPFHTFKPKDQGVEAIANELSVLQREIRDISPETAPSEEGKILALCEHYRKDRRYDAITTHLRLQSSGWAATVRELKTREAELASNSSIAAYAMELSAIVVRNMATFVGIVKDNWRQLPY
ncbi:MAG: hypothetical protein M1818_004889 [Claussenomyces sp. TS43310]|nr:MAG: hypothetical protein M1818_004889 [Claussenomyces sp. TS43310]